GYEGKRIAGVLGRVSDGVKVKGMFVREKQLAFVLEQQGYSAFQAIVTREEEKDELQILIESDNELNIDLSRKIQEVIRVKPELKRVAPDTINKEEKRLLDKCHYDLKKV